MERKKFGERLVFAGAITKEELDLALAKRHQSSERIGEILVGMGVATDVDICHGLASQFNLPVERGLPAVAIEPYVLGLLDGEFCARHAMLPLHCRNGKLAVAVADPLDARAAEDAAFRVGRSVEVSVAPFSEIQQAIAGLYN
jgi:hypothetical protein